MYEKTEMKRKITTIAPETAVDTLNALRKLDCSVTRLTA